MDSQPKVGFALMQNMTYSTKDMDYSVKVQSLLNGVNSLQNDCIGNELKSVAVGLAYGDDAVACQLQPLLIFRQHKVAIDHIAAMYLYKIITEISSKSAQ